jgi:hypothetical protein
MNITLEIVRIVMRYLAGALVAAGLLSPDDAPILLDSKLIEIVAGVVVALATEAGYAVAKMRQKG